jgi:hypothetical protein
MKQLIAIAFKWILSCYYNAFYYEIKHKSYPFRLFWTLDYFFTKFVHIQALHSSKASIDCLNKWPTYCCQFVTTTMYIRLISFGESLKTLGGNISKSDISLGNPLISDQRFSIENQCMSSISLMRLISQWTHHLNTIWLIDLWLQIKILVFK